MPIELWQILKINLHELCPQALSKWKILAARTAAGLTLLLTLPLLLLDVCPNLGEMPC